MSNTVTRLMEGTQSWPVACNRDLVDTLAMGELRRPRKHRNTLLCWIALVVILLIGLDLRELESRNGALENRQTVEVWSQSSKESNAEIPVEITQLVERWRSTLLAGDLEGHVDCYAPVVDFFFNESRASTEEVRSEKRRFLKRYPIRQQYGIRGLHLEKLEANKAVVTFFKDWEFRGERRFAGTEKQRLVLDRLNGAWKISSEEEARVYWVVR